MMIISSVYHRQPGRSISVYLGSIGSINFNWSCWVLWSNWSNWSIWFIGLFGLQRSPSVLSVYRSINSIWLTWGCCSTLSTIGLDRWASQRYHHDLLRALGASLPSGEHRGFFGRFAEFHQWPHQDGRTFWRMYVFLTPQNIYFVHPFPPPFPARPSFPFHHQRHRPSRVLFQYAVIFFFVIYANSAHVVAVPVVVVAVVMTHRSWYSFRWLKLGHLRRHSSTRFSFLPVKRRRGAGLYPFSWVSNTLNTNLNSSSTGWIFSFF